MPEPSAAAHTYARTHHRLVVDDDPDVTAPTMRRFRAQGFQVAVAIDDVGMRRVFAADAPVDCPVKMAST